MLTVTRAAFSSADSRAFRVPARLPGAAPAVQARGQPPGEQSPPHSSVASTQAHGSSKYTVRAPPHTHRNEEKGRGQSPPMASEQRTWKWTELLSEKQSLTSSALDSRVQSTPPRVTERSRLSACTWAQKQGLRGPATSRESPRAITPSPRRQPGALISICSPGGFFFNVYLLPSCATRLMSAVSGHT